ncbi:MAG: PEP-CTERM sorting domain-containing protein [Fimbriimonadaceae bacterium]
MKAISCLWLIVSWVHLAVCQPSYSVQEVLVNGKVAAGSSLSNSGWVVGYTEIDRFQNRAFRWQNGTGEVLHGFSGGGNDHDTEASGVNELGDAVGSAQNGEDYWGAALWDSQGFHDLGHLGDNYAWTNAVNNAKWGVGGSYVTSSDAHPFLARNGEMQDLGMLGIPQNHYGEAIAVNNVGIVLGFERDREFSAYTPWIWTDAGGMVRLYPDVFRGGGEVSDINDLGEVLNQRKIWKDGKTRTLPDAGGFWRINNNSDIIGYLLSTGDAGVWINQTPYDLQSLVLDQTYAIDEVRDINDSGQILATARRGGVTYSVLLTPVPEPATILSAAFGLAWLALRRRKR